MNKVKFNRFEKYIPDAIDNGILTVSNDETCLEYSTLNDFNKKCGRNNLTNGFDISFNENIFTIGKGQTFLYSKLGYEFNTENTTATLNVYNDIWGVNSIYKFEKNTYIINDINEHYNDEQNGCDYSVMVYNQPTMASNTAPYGVASSNSPHASANWSPWKAFNRVATGDNCFASADVAGAPFPVNLVYSVSADGSKWVKPKSFYIQNRNVTGAGIASPLVFTIQGSKVLHPYDDLDWVTLVNVDNVNLKQPTGQAQSNTYTTDTSEYFRHFRLHISSKSTTANYVAVQQFNINGEIKDNIALLNPAHNYFLVYAKKGEEYQTIFVSSKSNIPQLDSSLELIDYCPIYSYKNINDYNNMILYNKTSIDKIDISEYLTTNGLYKVYLTYSDNEYSYYISLNDKLPNDKVCKKIFEFKVLNNIVYDYYPKKSLNDSYLNRFIIAEQLGTTGYRIYSDGWKEQWGNLANPVFPIAFDEIPLIVERGATNVTKTGMTIASGNWFAKGY